MKLIFVFVSSLTGFFIGAFTASLIISKDEGLAGSASILLYGLLGLIISLIIAISIMKIIDRKLLIKIIIFLFLLNLLPVGWIIYKIAQSNSSNQQEENTIRTPTQISGSLISLILDINNEKNETINAGLGIATPDFFHTNVFYFYSEPNFDKAVNEHTPVDSIVFEQTEHHNINIKYAPPWFYPEHLKLDYEILYFKILAFNRDWLHVELNKETGYSAWLPRNNVTLKLWPDFLLTVFSIENIDTENNPIRIKPLKHASKIIIKDYEILTPVIINANWVKVNLLDKNLNKVGEGWIEWQREGKLIISYSLLS